MASIGTITYTLNVDYILVKRDTSIPITANSSNASVGIVVDIASGEPTWAVDDKIIYYIVHAINFLQNGVQYSFIPTEDIVSKYEIEAEP